MRKLAPLFVMTSILALAGGNALANSDAKAGSPDKVTGSPTVAPNTSNPQGLSYSDKSNTATGTNAKMDGSMAMDDKATTKKKSKKSKVAKNTTHSSTEPMTSGPSAGSTVSGASGTGLTGTTPPVSTSGTGGATGTNAAADNSTQGKSGQ